MFDPHAAIEAEQLYGARIIDDPVHAERPTADQLAAIDTAAADRLRHTAPPGASTSDPLLWVTATPTIQDGPVLRWWEPDGHHRPGGEMLSASRNGVMIGRSYYVHQVPAAALIAADRAYRHLAAGIRNPDAADAVIASLVTHRRGGTGVLGPLEPINPTDTGK